MLISLWKVSPTLINPNYMILYEKVLELVQNYILNLSYLVTKNWLYLEKSSNNKDISKLETICMIHGSDMVIVLFLV